jgi:hypothetical protein
MLAANCNLAKTMGSRVSIMSASIWRGRDLAFTQTK